MLYNLGMDKKTGIIGILLLTAATFFGSIVKAMVTIKDAIEGAQEQMAAAVFGVPVWVIHFISIAIGAIGLVAFIIRKIFK